MKLKSKPNKIKIAILTTILFSFELKYLLTSGTIDHAHKFVAANIVARNVQIDLLEFSSVDIPKLGMLSTISDPEVVQSMGLEFKAQVVYCPLPKSDPRDIPIFVSRAISQSSLKCDATTNDFREAEIGISIGGEKIYSLAMATTQKH
jgi:hypothetical protein